MYIGGIKLRFLDMNSKEDRQKYTEFLEHHERCNFQQSLEWGKVKNFWKNEVILAEDENNNIIGSLSVLLRKIPIFGYLMYSSRGPVCDIHDEKVLKQLTDGAKELAKKYHAMVLKIEPDIKSDDKEFREIVTKLGFKIKEVPIVFSERLRGQSKMNKKIVFEAMWGVLQLRFHNTKKIIKS